MFMILLLSSYISLLTRHINKIPFVVEMALEIEMPKLGTSQCVYVDL